MMLYTMTSAKHNEFIRLVASGETQWKSYKLSFPKKNLSKKTCEVENNKLAKRYALEIQQARENAQKVIEQASKEKEAEIALKQILTQAEVDAKLCKIINGELIEVQILNQQGKVFKELITPTISEQRAAIETYNKRFGSNAAEKIDQKIIVKYQDDEK